MRIAAGIPESARATLSSFTCPKQQIATHAASAANGNPDRQVTHASGVPSFHLGPASGLPAGSPSGGRSAWNSSIYSSRHRTGRVRRGRKASITRKAAAARSAIGRSRRLWSRSKARTATTGNGTAAAGFACRHATATARSNPDPVGFVVSREHFHAQRRSSRRAISDLVDVLDAIDRPSGQSSHDVAGLQFTVLMQLVGGSAGNEAGDQHSADRGPRKSPRDRPDAQSCNLPRIRRIESSTPVCSGTPARACWIAFSSFSRLSDESSGSRAILSAIWSKFAEFCAIRAARISASKLRNRANSLEPTWLIETLAPSSAPRNWPASLLAMATRVLQLLIVTTCCGFGQTLESSFVVRFHGDIRGKLQQFAGTDGSVAALQYSLPFGQLQAHVNQQARIHFIPRFAQQQDVHVTIKGWVGQVLCIGRRRLGHNRGRIGRFVALLAIGWRHAGGGKCQAQGQKTGRLELTKIFYAHWTLPVNKRVFERSGSGTDSGPDWHRPRPQRERVKERTRPREEIVDGPTQPRGCSRQARTKLPTNHDSTCRTERQACPSLSEPSKTIPRVLLSHHKICETRAESAAIDGWTPELDSATCTSKIIFTSH